jgi:predicted XRE-type DNA-binding protein
MMSLTEAMKAQGLTQVQAAALFGVTQPRISDLTRGKVVLFSLDAQVDMATTAGMAPTIKVTMPKKPAPRTAARKVSSVAYASQSEDEVARMWRKQSKLEALLGPNWRRPKGMHRKTRESILARVWECEGIRDDAIYLYCQRMGLDL